MRKLFSRSAKLTPERSSLRFAVKWALAKQRFTNGTATADRKKYGCLGVTELWSLRQIEEENQQLKHLVADLSLDKQMLQVIKKSFKASPKKRSGPEFDGRLPSIEPGSL